MVAHTYCTIDILWRIIIFQLVQAQLQCAPTCHCRHQHAFEADCQGVLR